MSKTTNKVAARNARQTALLASAAAIGYAAANGYQGCVDLLRSCNSNLDLIKAVTKQYVAGYVVRYLEARGYAKRWGNMSAEQRYACGLDIIGKSMPDSDRNDRRTDLEHKAVRAANVSVSGAKRELGLTKPIKRQTKTSTANDNAKAPPVDLVKAAPKFAKRVNAVDYIETAAAALLVTVNKNAILVPPQLSTAVSDFHDAVKAAIKLLKSVGMAGSRKPAKAKAAAK